MYTYTYTYTHTYAYTYTYAHAYAYAYTYTVLGNSIADRLAKQGAKLHQLPCLVSKVRF